MATKRASLESHVEGLLSYSHINFVSLLLQCLWPPNLPVWSLMLRGSSHIVTSTLYLRYSSVYGHQTCQFMLESWLLSYSYINFHQLVLLRSRDSSKSLCLHRLIATKLGSVLTTTNRCKTQTLKSSPASYLTH